ncbi:hypothetical protein [Burkholderia ubonensis]|uniref:hypothetical protein n=1 Tax=Burkholderia ubonensis TaxID=101571 RepID=UPI000F55EE37|nr:hypothetical protein [Burkholderia ubonensis]
MAGAGRGGHAKRPDGIAAAAERELPAAATTGGAFHPEAKTDDVYRVKRRRLAGCGATLPPTGRGSIEPVMRGVFAEASGTLLQRTMMHQGGAWGDHGGRDDLSSWPSVA